MKKVMVVLAALTMSVAVQAASLVWGGFVANECDAAQTAQAGTVFNLIAVTAGFDATGLVYDKTTGLLGTGSGSSFKAAEGQTLVGTHTLTADESANYGFQSVFERTDAAGGVNGSYLMTMFDATTPDKFWAGSYSVSGVSDLTTAGSIEDTSWSIGYGMTVGVTDSAGGGVPEPTSGLLLLVGGALLALRRKQK